MSSKVACLYIRVSTEDQTELSPDAQKRLLLDYAQKNDMIVSGDFIFTESVSGRHAQKRPEFQKMIALAKQPSHPIDVILVWKFSRLDVYKRQDTSIPLISMSVSFHREKRDGFSSLIRLYLPVLQSDSRM